MAAAAKATGTQAARPETLSTAAASAIQAASPPPSASPSSAADRQSNTYAKLSPASEKPAARINDSPSPGVGPAAAKLLNVGPEKAVVYCEGTL
jgi:hypothetical protein